MENTSPLSCNLKGNVTGNWSIRPHPISTASASMFNLDEFLKFAFGCAIYMIIVSFTTIVTNAFLLVVFFFDPLRHSVTPPSTYFLIGLAFIDVLTAVTQEPLYATCLIMVYLGYPKTRYDPLFEIADTIAFDTMNASFLVVLAFTFTQYIVVISPLNHARKVTKNACDPLRVSHIYLHYILQPFTSDGRSKRHSNEDRCYLAQQFPVISDHNLLHPFVHCF